MKFRFQGVTIFSAPIFTPISVLLTQQPRHPFFMSFYYTLIQPNVYHQHGHRFIWPESLFNSDTYQGHPKLDTGPGRPALAGNEIWVILRALRPVPESLFFYSPDYNPVISNEEPSDLRIQFHHLDIETGDVSPSSIPCFLPRPIFPRF